MLRYEKTVRKLLHTTCPHLLPGRHYRRSPFFLRFKIKVERRELMVIRYIMDTSGRQSGFIQYVTATQGL